MHLIDLKNDLFCDSLTEQITLSIYLRVSKFFKEKISFENFDPICVPILEKYSHELSSLKSIDEREILFQEIGILTFANLNLETDEELDILDEMALHIFSNPSFKKDELSISTNQFNRKYLIVGDELEIYFNLKTGHKNE
jgi:hypothetical protein